LAEISGNSETLQLVRECYKNKLKSEETNLLLLRRDNKGMTALHLEVFWGSSETLKKYGIGLKEIKKE